MFTAVDWIDSPWAENALSAKQELPITGIPEDVLLHIAKNHYSGGPQGFITHKGWRNSDICRDTPSIV